MADVLLSIGLQKTAADVSRLRADVESMLSRLDKNPPKVKVGLTVSTEALNTFKTQLQNIINSIVTANGTPISLKIDGLGQITAEAKQAGEAMTQTAQQIDRAVKQTSNSIKSAETSAASFGRLGLTDNGALERLQQYIGQLNELRSATASGALSQDEYAQSYDNITAKIAIVTEELQRYKIAQQDAAPPNLVKGTEEYNTALEKINASLAKVTAAQKNWTASKTGTTSAEYDKLQQYANALTNLRTRLTGLGVPAEEVDRILKQVNTNFASTSTVIRSAGEATTSLTSRFASLAKTITAMYSSTRIVMMLISQTRKMISTSIELDDAMTQLRVVTQSTDAEYEKFGHTISDTAKRIGASTSDLIDSTTTFARLGYTLNESASLAEYTAKLSNVGDIETSDAQDAMTAIIKAYDKDVSELETIMDKMVVVGR